MNDAALQAELERAEEAYENLMRTRATLGSALAEAIRRGRDLSEFGQHIRDLPHLIRRADVRRAELRVELLARRGKEAQEGHRRGGCYEGLRAGGQCRAAVALGGAALRGTASWGDGAPRAAPGGGSRG